MVSAWLMTDCDCYNKNDQRLPHKCEPNVNVTLDHLAKLGVLYFTVNADRIENNEQLEKIRKERNYKNHDFITIASDKLPNYEQKIKDFFAEHLHEDEEIRFILDGSGYFDVRSIDQKQWIRIAVHKNDLLVLPAGIYHRFTVDENNYIKAMRLFQDQPKWTPINRSITADALPARSAYFELIKKCATIEQKSSSNVSPNGKSFILQTDSRVSLPFPHLRRVNGFLYVSGTTSRQPDNSHIGATLLEDGTWKLDIEEQTRGTIQNIERMLKVAGADLSHIVDVTTYLADMKYYNGYNQVYNTFFNAETGPTRTTVAVHQLPLPQDLIEMKIIAVAPQQQSSL